MHWQTLQIIQQQPGYFLCSKCSRWPPRPKPRARAKQCTSCHELRCEECLAGCVDCSLPHCCGVNHCQTCGFKVCTKCSSSHSCALSAEDEETPLTWTDAFEQRGAHTTDQLVIDVGEAVIILTSALRFSNQLMKCDFYDFRSRQMSTIHLSLPADLFGKVVPNRWAYLRTSESEQFSVVGCDRKLLFFDGRDKKFLVVNLSGTVQQWKPLDLRLASGEQNCGFVVLACGAAAPSAGSNALTIVVCWMPSQTQRPFVIAVHRFYVGTGR